MSIKKLERLLVAAAVCAVGAPAMADSTWDLGGCTNQQTTNSGTYGNTYVCAGTNSGGNVTVSAYGGANSTASTGYQNAYLAQYGSGSGFGVASKYETIGVGSPNHSMDNDPTTSVAPDMILLKFDNLVSLKTIGLGWTQSDADLTVMAYTGTGTPTIVGKTATTLGWQFVQNVGDKDTGSGYAATSNDTTYTTGGSGGLNVGATTSSWWLISAYSAGFGGSTVLDSLLDYVKLLSVAGTVTTPQAGKAPEPGSLALVATAMVLLGISRRRFMGRSGR